jgi:hypothetical protein
MTPLSSFAPAVAFAPGDDVGVVDEAVDHGGGDVVTEDLAPADERLVAGDD